MVDADQPTAGAAPPLDEAPGRRRLLLIVLLVIVAYVACQSFIVHLIKSEISPTEYSNDPGNLFESNSTRMKLHFDEFCDTDETHREEFYNNTTISPVNITLVEVNTTDSSLRLQVLSVMAKVVDGACEYLVSYFVCNSKLGPYSYKYEPSEKGFSVTELDSLLTEYNDDSEITFVDASLGHQVVIYYRKLQKPEEAMLIRKTLIAIVQYIIPVPIASTLAVYLYLPELRNLQGKIVVCKLLSELVYSIPPTLLDQDQSLVVLMCSCVAGITWTSVLCYDVWAVFSNYLPVSRSSGSGRKFLYYSLVGWGHPGAFGAMLWYSGVKLSRRSSSAPAVILYTVYIFLNILNLIFFSFTVKNIVSHNSRTLPLVRGGRLGRPAAEGPYLYFRISALMGILSFIFENVDIVLTSLVKHDYDFFDVFFYACSLIDKTLYFIILVCNKRVLSLLRKKFKVEPES